MLHLVAEQTAHLVRLEDSQVSFCVRGAFTCLLFTTACRFVGSILPLI